MPVARPHPAVYSKQLLPILARLLEGKTRILDPFAGRGERLLSLVPHACLNELQYKWACATRRGVVGDALHLPYPTEWFEVVVTSVTYGNRMADRFIDRQPEKHYKRNTYTHQYGEPLDPRNSGRLQWGTDYRRLHHAALYEIWRVLAPGGLYVLNISDHIRNFIQIPVSKFHRRLTQAHGFLLQEQHLVLTSRQRQGENGHLRVAGEQVYVFRKDGGLNG